MSADYRARWNKFFAPALRHIRDLEEMTFRKDVYLKLFQHHTFGQEALKEHDKFNVIESWFQQLEHNASLRPMSEAEALAYCEIAQGVRERLDALRDAIENRQQLFWEKASSRVGRFFGACKKYIATPLVRVGAFGARIAPKDLRNAAFSALASGLGLPLLLPGGDEF